MCIFKSLFNNSEKQRIEAQQRRDKAVKALIEAEQMEPIDWIPIIMRSINHKRNEEMAEKAKAQKEGK